MKVVLQRVSSAMVSVDDRIIGQLRQSVGGEPGNNVGLLALVGVEQGDLDEDSVYLAQKTADLRIFNDENGKMNLSVQDVGGSILVVSQFTLIADWRKGRRPGFSRAAAPEEGNRLYLHYVNELKKRGLHVETGQFGADMQVSLINDGPVTLLLESRLAFES